jgi:hypothetical protein
VFRFSHAHDAAQVLHDGKGRVQGEVVRVVESVKRVEVSLETRRTVLHFFLSVSFVFQYRS